MHIESSDNHVKLGGQERRNFRFFCDLLLRFLVIITALVAVIVMWLAKETEIVQFTLIPGIPAIDILATAKSTYLSANIYFLVANIVACVYAAISFILLRIKRSRSKGFGGMIIMADIVMVALPFSANGGAAGQGMIARKGNKHAHWMKICNMFEKFCMQVTASLLVSQVASFIFLFIAVFGVHDLNQK